MMNVYLAIKGEKCMDTECLKNIFSTNQEQCVTNKWNYESDLLRSDFQ